MKYSFVLLSCMLVILMLKTTKAQTTTVHFVYDENGNRVKRWLTVTPYKSADSIDVAEAFRQMEMDTLSFESDKDLFSYKVYPNPAREVIHLEQSQAKEMVDKYMLFDAGLRPVREGIVSSSHTEISIEELSSGTYILIIKDAIRQETFVIVKQ